jgi:endoribonuclease Dicer
MAWAGDVEEQDDYFSCDDMPTSGDEGQDSPSVVEADEVGDSDSDIDADISRTHGPKTTSERRRAQNEVMRAFAANISASITQGEVEQAHRAPMKANSRFETSLRARKRQSASQIHATIRRNFFREQRYRTRLLF